MTPSNEVPTATEASSNGQRENAAAAYTREVLAAALSRDYQVHQGANLLYRIEIDSSDKTSNDGQDTPRRGSMRFRRISWSRAPKRPSLWSS